MLIVLSNINYLVCSSLDLPLIFDNRKHLFVLRHYTCRKFFDAVVVAIVANCCCNLLLQLFDAWISFIVNDLYPKNKYSKLSKWNSQWRSSFKLCWYLYLFAVCVYGNFRMRIYIMIWIYMRIHLWDLSNVLDLPQNNDNKLFINHMAHIH